MQIARRQYRIFEASLVMCAHARVTVHLRIHARLCFQPFPLLSSRPPSARSTDDQRYRDRHREGMRVMRFRCKSAKGRARVGNVTPLKCEYIRANISFFTRLFLLFIDTNGKGSREVVF